VVSRFGNVAKVARLSSPATEPWPARLPEQVALVKKLITRYGTDPATLSAAFGKANKKRQEQIEGILETLRGLGLLRGWRVGFLLVSDPRPGMSVPKGQSKALYSQTMPSILTETHSSLGFRTCFQPSTLEFTFIRQ
jgi:hypothetical protein